MGITKRRPVTGGACGWRVLRLRILRLRSGRCSAQDAPSALKWNHTPSWARVEVLPQPAYNNRVKSRLLAVKIGNSNIGVGVFEGPTLRAHWRCHTDTSETADEYALMLNDFFEPLELAADGWRGAILVSVVPPLTGTFQAMFRKHFGVNPLVAGPRLKTGMPIRYDDPRALGADRLVAAVAARARYGAPVIVVDFGTATTFNVVDRAGVFVGGAIAPGMSLAADALYHSTAQLPRIDLTVPPRVISTNTVHALQSGIVYGYLGLIEAMVRRIRNELGEPEAPVVATGGLARLVAPQTWIVNHWDPELIFYGLSLLYEMNAVKGATDDMPG